MRLSSWLANLRLRTASRTSNRIFRSNSSRFSLAATAVVERLEPRQLLSPTPLGVETPVSSPSSGNQLAPVVASDSAGDSVVVWQTFGGNTGLEAQLFTAAGTPNGGNFSIPMPGILEDAGVSVAMDAAGDFVVAYVGFANGEIQTTAQLFNANGVASGSPIVASTQRFNTPPSVAMDAQGDFVVAWNNYGGIFGTGPDVISAQRYNSSGVAQGGTFEVGSVPQPQGEESPSVPMDAAGDFVVVDGAGLIRLYDSSGVPVGGLVNGSTISAYPKVAMDASGDFVISSNEKTSTGYDATAQRYNASGVPQGGLIVANPVEGNPNTYNLPDAAVSMDSDGDFVMTWPSVYGITDSSEMGVLAQEFSAAGVPQGNAFQVNTFTLNNQNEPAVAMDHSGNFIVAWQSQQVTSAERAGIGYGIYSQRYTSGPLLTGIESTPLDVSGAATTPITSTLAFNQNVSVVTGATVTISSNDQPGEDQLGFVNTPNIKGTWDPTTGTLTLTGTDTAANYIAALRSVTYHDTSATANTSTRTISFQAFDGAIRGNVVSREINVTALIIVDESGDKSVAGHYTLRDAIAKANSDRPGDVIEFASNVSGTITLTQGQLVISNSMTITGPGAGVLTISGKNVSRVFDVASTTTSTNTVTISNLTIANGNDPSDVNDGLGGGVYNIENLTLLNDVFSNNTAKSTDTSSGGAVYNAGTLSSTNDIFTKNSAMNGGGVFNDSGIMTSTEDTFTDNTAVDAGGGLGNAAVLFTKNDSFAANSARTGGGISNTWTLDSSSDTFSGNSATTIGGGGLNDGTMSSTNDTFAGNTTVTGGAVYLGHGTFTSVNDTVANNSGTGVEVSQGRWNSLNTIVAGNLIASGSTTPSDVVVNSGGTINAFSTLIGNASSAGGIVNGTNHDIVGKATNAIFVTGPSGQPLLASNGGPTKTIELAVGSPALDHGGPLATTTAAIAQSDALTTIALSSSTDFAIGDLVKIGSEIVLVTAVPDATHIVVQRAQMGTTAAADLANATVNLATDQSGAARTTIDLGSLAQISHAPSGTSGTVATITNRPYAFKISDFGFKDPNDTPPNTLVAVKIALLPTLGQITDNGVPISVNQLISAADINTGKLEFTPQTNLIGGPYFVCKFEVQDSGSTVNGGVNVDPNAKVLDIKISNLNHAPVGTPNTVTAIENTLYVFKVADFGFTDPDDNPPNWLQAVIMTTVPTVGSLTDNGKVLVAGACVPAADISAGILKFAPAANATGAAYASFTFQVQDNGGTLDGGVNTDPTPRKMTISVIHINHAPVGTSGTVSTLENTAYAIKTGDFGFTDPNDTPPNTLLAVKITIVPTLGKLTDNGVAVVAGQFISASDISSCKLVFTPKANLTGGPYFMCQFQVEDNGGTANGGVNIDPIPKVLDIKIQP